MVDICNRHWFPIWVEPEYGFMGYIDHQDYWRRYFSNSHLWINTASAASIAKDKTYTIKLLEQFWYLTTQGDYFFCDTLNKSSPIKRWKNEAMKYAQEIGFPLIVKPNDKSQGFGVQKIWDDASLLESIDNIFEVSSILRVEKFITWGDYRIVVLDNDIVCAYERVPLRVIWNGILSIKELLVEKSKIYNAAGRTAVIQFDHPQILNNLRRRGYSMDTIPAVNLPIPLLDTGNLSTGGECIDITWSIHEDYKKLAVTVSTSLWLRFCGIDIKSDSLLDPLRGIHHEYAILEVNSAPWFMEYLSCWEEQRTRVYNLFEKIITGP